MIGEIVGEVFTWVALAFVGFWLLFLAVVHVWVIVRAIVDPTMPGLRSIGGPND